MRRAKTIKALVAVCCVVAVALSGVTAASAQAPKKPPVKVTVNDFYFAPTAVTIRKGRAVKWVWSSYNTYPHDVHLKQGPKALKNKSRFSTTTTAVTGAHFQRTFEVPGTYKFICTVHPSEMKMTVTVKK
ncbi:MAG TPA: plastocyanin/azurin family copper-binding protein [Solirubrobacterales bacterium]|jgi:plastocyanin|nr:plastocyanin/azurin family copper-binding protein [Solirubrobacterales bacterium]